MEPRVLGIMLSLFAFMQTGALHGVPHAGILAAFIDRAGAIAEGAGRRQAVAEFMRTIPRTGAPFTEDSTVSFIYCGPGGCVRVASDLNAWSPIADTMEHLRGTEFHYFSLRTDPAARFEYKLVVDSTWILDPANPRQAMGGYGPNSEVTMPLYRAPEEINVRPGVPRGRLDTLQFRSMVLNRSIPITVYLPHVSRPPVSPPPVLFVLDGGEYLSLALMNVVLDNLIADGAIVPPVCVFLDPRTDPRNPQTNTRMRDYSMSDSFVTALVTEIRPSLMKKYRFTGEAANTGIMGASLGGLAAIHAAFEHPEVFGLCAAQSPSLWWQDARMLRRIEEDTVKPLRVYIGTGTIRDAQLDARRAREALTARGYRVLYEEHPEGHNWFNWRARIGSILRFFWGRT